jgi:RNA polymerase sigma factor (sigma-70 family)
MHTNLIPDQKLVVSYLEGNEAALEMLIRRYKQKVMTSIYMLVHDRYLAEDIFQETFIKVIHSLRQGKYQHEGKFLPWVIRIARNLCIDHIRRRKKMPTITDGEGKDVFGYIKVDEPNAHDRIESSQTNSLLMTLIEKLPDEQREVLILRHYGELSFKEIADLTGCSINTALGRMRYAILNLRKMMVFSSQRQ